MKRLTLNQKRIFAGVYGLVLLLTASNRYLGWGFFGSYAAAVSSFVVLIGAIGWATFGPAMTAATEDHQAALRAAEDETASVGSPIVPIHGGEATHRGQGSP